MLTITGARIVSAKGTATPISKSAPPTIWVMKIKSIM